eukprot:TRINITY_DN20361_c0_g1_i1.p1 TRINITY_DN20361_c0_g1~~TRINITY_DN20361_c0_g1_i1.p1  ORF type:complete len:457 (+),score=46.80 TRINITY_DN20361_c0_g1_i1:104-1474(+)
MLSNFFGLLTKTEESYEPLSKAEVDQLPVVPHYVYACLSEHVYGDALGRSLPKGWEVFMTCSEVHLDREGYGGTAYYNESLHHIIIAQRGTIDAAGLRAGVWVYFDEPTIQFTLSAEFSKVVRLKANLAHPLQPVTISYTGHSLGGVLATCRAIAEQTYGIVFETPGCKGFVERITHPFRYDEADVIVYVRPPNTINSLKPQVGYLVQLPPQDYVRTNREIASESAQKKIAQMLPTLQLPDVTGFLGKKIIERSVPELYDYLSKVEPVVRDIFDQTQQFHSIHNIVPLYENAEGAYCEPECELVDKWPTHLMQFFEYFSVQQSLEKVTDEQPHLRAAYEELLKKIYFTKKRDDHHIPIAWISEDSRELLGLWENRNESSKSRDPNLKMLLERLSLRDKRVLASCTIDRDVLKTSGHLTSFQVKQYLFLLVRKPPIADILSLMSYSKATTDDVKSKL